MSNREAEGNEDVSIDVAFDALGDPHRRAVCRYALRTDADIVTCEELVDFLAERDHVSGPAETARGRNALETELHHIHLPALADAGMIEYEPHSGAVYVDRDATAALLERVRATVADLQSAPSDR